MAFVQGKGGPKVLGPPPPAPHMLNSYEAVVIWPSRPAPRRAEGPPPRGRAGHRGRGSRHKAHRRRPSALAMADVAR
jgi:hypothetical protein